MNRPHEHGAAMVEMAIVLMLFLILVFGIIEFSMAIFSWSRVIESTRAGARYAIVNNIETGCASLTCPDGAAVTCDLAEDSPILDKMRSRVGTGVLSVGKAKITYACANGTGLNDPDYPDDWIRQVTVTVTGVEHTFVVGELLGVGATMVMPDYSTTRTSEDLYTTP